jgi:hypothetical protein
VRWRAVVSSPAPAGDQLSRLIEKNGDRCPKRAMKSRIRPAMRKPSSE